LTQLFFGLKVINPLQTAGGLSTPLHVHINGKCKKLPTLKVNFVRIFADFFAQTLLTCFGDFFLSDLFFYEKFCMYALQDKK
jgi:hypothetical protein